MLFLQDRYGPAIISALHRDGARQGLDSVQAALDTVAAGTKVTDVLHDYQLMNLLDAYVDGKGGTVTGIAKDRVTTESLNAAVNVFSPSAYAKPGAAPNGADYVLLRANGEPVTGATLRSLAFTGARTAMPAPDSEGDLVVPLGGDTREPAGAAVENWRVSLVGIDKAGRRALVRSVDGAYTTTFTAKQLAAFARYPMVVAVISHDAPDNTDTPAEYANYTLAANGTTQPGS